MPLKSPRQNRNGSGENTGVLAPPNTCSASGVGNLFFPHLGVRKAAKRLPRAVGASSFPVTWRQPGRFLHRCGVDRNVNPRKRGRKTVRRQECCHRIAPWCLHLPPVPRLWHMLFLGCCRSQGNKNWKKPVGAGHGGRRLVEKHKWVSMFSYPVSRMFLGKCGPGATGWVLELDWTSVSIPSVPLLITKPWASHLTCSYFVQATEI